MLLIVLETELIKREFTRKLIPEKVDDAQVVTLSRCALLSKNIFDWQNVGEREYIEHSDKVIADHIAYHICLSEPLNYH